MNNIFLWAEAYRPKLVKDAVLPKGLKDRFQSFVDQGNIPNLLLVGHQGSGKTTIAKAMVEELGCDYYVVNGSLDRNIDTLRNEIYNFCSSMSFLDKRKYVILDEADYLNNQSTQPALRNFIEKFSENAGFILTANYLSKIIKPLQSRCAVIDFKIEKKELTGLAIEFLKRLEIILQTENIEYDKKVLIALIEKFIPDWRRIINELQSYSVNGIIDTGILSRLNNSESFRKLISFMKEKNFTNVRKWVEENLNNDAQSLFKEFYDYSSTYFETSYIPELVLLLADYQYKSAFIADQSINTSAFLVEIMISAKYK